MRLIRTPYVLFLLFMVITTICNAQSYRQDSLQIKSYTVIEYRNNEPQEVKLVKVLCDYCTKLQSKAIGEEAVRRSYSDRYNPANRMENGQKKLAIYIRISKIDFAAIKKE